MKKYQSVFDRYEKKYILTQQQYANFMQKISHQIKEGEFSDSLVHSIYFDDEEYNMIQKSLSKPKYKEKIRARFYGTFSLDQPYYLEIKKKYDGIVYKRRYQVTYQQVQSFINNPLNTSKQHQIAKELSWIANCNNIKPQYYIYYERKAYCALEDEEIRLTFDQHLTYRNQSLDFKQGGEGQMLLDDQLVLLEVKTPDVLPLWLVRALESENIRSTSFSKVGTAFQKTHLKGEAKL